MVWRGWGLLVVFFVVLAWVAPPLLLKTVFGPPVSFLLAGVASIVTGLYLSRGREAVPDGGHAERSLPAPRFRVLHAPHSFLLLSLEAWGVLLILLALAFFIAGVGPHAD